VSNSKFGLPQIVQQPPPVCKKGPPKVPLDPAWPPSVLIAAVTYDPDDPTYYPFLVQRLLTLLPTGSPNEWKGDLNTDIFPLTFSMTFNPSFSTWSCHLTIVFPNGLSDSADVLAADLRKENPFETYLEERRANSDMATASVKILT